MDVWEDRNWGWLLEHADRLRRQGLPAGIAALHLAVAFIEPFEVFVTGKRSDRQSKTFFKRGVRRIIGQSTPTLSEDDLDAVATALHEEMRCGLFHSGMPGLRVFLTNAQPGIEVKVGAATRQIVQISLNPDTFTQGVVTAFAIMSRASTIRTIRKPGSSVAGSNMRGTRSISRDAPGRRIHGGGLYCSGGGVRFEAPMMTDGELITAIEAQRGLMVAVATGGPRIQEVDDEYVARREQIHAELSARGLRDPNPYADLWAWYGKWSSGDLPSYQSRRMYLAELYKPLTDRLRQGQGAHGAAIFEEPTGWARVDRGLGEIRHQLEQARTEEQFQAVGLHCREVLISAAQQVYDSERHRSPDGVVPSETDAKRMLDAYLLVELAGGPNAALRKHVRASFDLANELQHHRTATFRQAAICAEATTAVVNLLSILAGRRDP